MQINSKKLFTSIWSPFWTNGFLVFKSNTVAVVSLDAAANNISPRRLHRMQLSRTVQNDREESYGDQQLIKSYLCLHYESERVITWSHLIRTAISNFSYDAELINCSVSSFFKIINMQWTWRFLISCRFRISLVQFLQEFKKSIDLSFSYFDMRKRFEWYSTLGFKSTTTL